MKKDLRITLSIFGAAFLSFALLLFSIKILELKNETLSLVVLFILFFSLFYAIIKSITHIIRRKRLYYRDITLTFFCLSTICLILSLFLEAIFALLFSFIFFIITSLFMLKYYK